MKRTTTSSPLKQAQIRNLFGASIPRIRGLLEYYLENGQLFDALNAVCILDGVKAPTTLTELAAQYVRNIRTAGMVAGTISLCELLDRYAATLAPDQKSSISNYRTSSRIVAKTLGDEFPAEKLTLRDITSVLRHYDAEKSRNGIATRIRTALRWGVREHLITNPVAESIRLRPERFKEPCFFDAAKVERIFRIVEEHPGNPKGNPGMFLSLGFLAGVRTAEILRATWEDIRLEDGVVRIPQPKGWTRGVCARVVELEPNAREWMLHWTNWMKRLDVACTGPIIRSGHLFTTWKKRYLEPEGLSWGNGDIQNVMRHTYATMHVAAFRNAEATALNLGHTSGVETLLRHYRGLCPSVAAKPYWEMRPRPEGSYPEERAKRIPTTYWPLWTPEDEEPSSDEGAAPAPAGAPVASPPAIAPPSSPASSASRGLASQSNVPSSFSFTLADVWPTGG